MNLNNSIAIEYNQNIISSIDNMIEVTSAKINSFVKSKQGFRLDIYYELDQKFNDIALKLDRNEIFHDELDYFLLISDKILYITHKNCENNLFGHFNFALDLFDFFLDIWNAKLNLINNFSMAKFEKHQKLKNEFNEKYFRFNKEFHMEIYEPSEKYCEIKIYKIMASMRPR